MMELDLEEILALAESIGFEVVGEGAQTQVEEHLRRKTVACEYTADKMGMFQRIYQAEFWVAKKRR